VLDISKGVCEPHHVNGSVEYRIMVYHPLFVLNSVKVPPEHMQSFSMPLEMMQFAFHWHNMFSEGRFLVEDEQRSR
jgi:hypothetical protein